MKKSNIAMKKLETFKKTTKLEAKDYNIYHYISPRDKEYLTIEQKYNSLYDEAFEFDSPILVKEYKEIEAKVIDLAFYQERQDLLYRKGYIKLKASLKDGISKIVYSVYNESNYWIGFFDTFKEAKAAFEAKS